MKLAILLAALLFAAVGARAEVSPLSAQVLYNEGNAHARAQEWGLAVLDYQRARLLAPNDPDIEANLGYVRAAAKVSVASPDFAQRLARVTTPDIAAALGLLGLVLLGCALVLRSRMARVAALLTGTSLTAFMVGHAIGLRPLLSSAVVVGGATPVQASPVPMADTLFSLPEATSVSISAARPDYLLVTTDSGKSGWVPRAHVVAVLPTE